LGIFCKKKRPGRSCCSAAWDLNACSKHSITHVWIPPLAGSDEFEQTVDYAHMDQVEHGKIGHYGCADTDTTIRITRRLVPEAMRDERHYNCYERVQMPALRMFVDVERRGIQIDIDQLRKFTGIMEKEEQTIYDSLIGAVHPDIKRKHLDLKNKNRYGLNFSRDSLVADHLFKPVTDKNGKVWGHNSGMKLTPRLFTPTGQPSISTKQHMPYFEEEPWVAEFMEWEKITKLQSTYLGEEGHYVTKKKRGGDEYEEWVEPTGIWQYISDKDGCIRPSYLLHRTVTGRTASLFGLLRSR
jgi:hypothetical protein